MIHESVFTAWLAAGDVLRGREHLFLRCLPRSLAVSVSSRGGDGFELQQRRFRRLIVQSQFWWLVGRRQIVFSTSALIGLSLSLVAAEGGGLQLLGVHLVAALAFSAVGIAVLAICFFAIRRMLPFSVTKEIEEDQNVALAIIIAAVILGISHIIAAAITG